MDLHKANFGADSSKQYHRNPLEEDMVEYNKAINDSVSITHDGIKARIISDQIKLDSSEFKLLARIVKLNMFSDMMLILVVQRSADLWLKSRRIRFVDNGIFPSIRRSWDVHFWVKMPIIYCTTTVLMLMLVRNDLRSTFSMKYFLEPHMRFEVNTGTRLELYKDPEVRRQPNPYAYEKFIALKKLVSSYQSEYREEYR